jgi:hypothetical protein
MESALSTTRIDGVHNQRIEEHFGGFLSFDEDSERYYDLSFESHCSSNMLTRGSLLLWCMHSYK